MRDLPTAGVGFWIDNCKIFAKQKSKPYIQFCYDRIEESKLILLTADKLNKNFGGRQILDNVSLTVSEGDKIGVIGVNGAGKSTFLKLIAGEDLPDSGEVTRISRITVGYLPQNPVFQKHASVLEQVLHDVAAGKSGFSEYECKAILTKLGITDFEQDVSELSGGQKKRVAMASALASRVDLLVLDEPTNHLDVETILWLEDFLHRYTGALLMVTHDRYFLERVANRMVELDRGILTAYPANYSRYLELKEEREAMSAASERKRQALLKKELEWIRRGARARGTKARFRVDRYEELSSQKSPEEQKQLTLSALSSRLGKKVIEIDDISKRYGNRTLFSHFTYNLLRGDRLGIIGENGCGKSTLIRILTGKLAPDTGRVSIGETVKIGYFSQESEEMDLNLRVIDYIQDHASRIETPDGTFSASQMLERFLFPPELQYTTIGRLSGGERRRLFLLRILMDAPNVLFLDEPTNDLDIQTLTVLEDYLERFPGAVVAVSHDRYFLDKIAEHTFAFEKDGTLRQYLGGYSDYLAQKKDEPSPSPEKSVEKKAVAPRPRQEKLKFSFKEQHEFAEIDDVIASLEQQIAETEKEMEAQASNYELLPQLLEKKEELEKTLSEKMDRWVYLNDLAERISQQ